MLGGTCKMGLLLMLLLGTIALTTGANIYIVSKFEIDSTKGAFSHMVRDKKSGNIYASAMNSLYQLSSNLTLIKNVTTGPKNDSPNCQPQNINASCDQPKTPTNTYNKALIIDYNNNTLIACSSLYHGICERYNLSDIDSKDPDIYVPVVANNATSTTVAFIAPGPLDGSSQSEVLYVAASRTNAGLSVFRDHIPALASRKLKTFDLFYKGINTSSSKSIMSMHRDTFPVDYIYGFSSNNFSYFVTVQKQNPSTESYISKLIRVCQADKDYHSYAEVQLKCMYNGALYNLAQAAYVAKAAFPLSKIMNISMYEDVLYIVFSIRSPSTAIPGSESALCIYPLRIVRRIFTENIKTCFNGIGNTGPSHIITEVACQKMNSSFKIDDDYCGSYGINTPIDGQTPIQTEAAITFNTTVSAVAVKMEYLQTIVFVGTVKGHIIKVLIKSKQMATAHKDLTVEEGNKIYADMIFDAGEKHLYALTDTKIFKISLKDCISYTTCASCVGDPDCGWRHYLKQCDRWDKGWIYQRSIHLCTSPVHLFPASMQKGFQETIQLEVADFNFDLFLTTNGYGCNFTSGNVSIMTQANYTNRMTFTCYTPPSNQLPPIQPGEDHIVMNLSLLINGRNLGVTNFTFFDCSLQISCRSCTQSNFPCTWCINNHTCTFDMSGCPENKLILGRTNPVLVTISPSRGPKSGGSLVTLSGNYMNAGTNRSVWIGNHSCEVKCFNATMLTCVTSRASDTIVEKLVVQFDNQTVTSNITYEYTTDPTVIKTDPKVAIVSGGILIDVIGKQLDTIQEPKMIIGDAHNKYGEVCKVVNSTLMHCYSPQVKALINNENTSSDTDKWYSYGFILDNVTEVLNLTEKDLSKYGTFRIVHDPVFESFPNYSSKPYDYFPGQTFIIRATSLDGVSERDVTVKIGIGFCTDIDLANNQITCKPPKDQPKSLNGSANPEVIVCVGRNFAKLVGYMHYDRINFLHPAIIGFLIIGLPVSVVVLVIIVLVILVIKKREKNMKKKWQVQMDILESKVARECKEDNTVASGASGPVIDKSTLSVLKHAKLIIDGNRLHLGDIIGKGHFGCVLKGYLTLAGDKGVIRVAIKTLHKKNLSDIDVDAFLKEIMIMKEFHHPNVLRLLGICLGLNDIPLMVLPFMEHGDLLSYIRDDTNTPTVKDLIHFGIGIAEGMAYLSYHKFVHRDLAARNCMLDKELNVKVADFGLSREIYEKEYYSSESKKTKLPIRWMAPESMEKGTYSSKSDVWSYGIVLWELLTRGVTPYYEVDNWDIVRYLQKGRRLPQPQCCPDKVYDNMQKCWIVDPQDRPTFNALAREMTYLMSVAEHDMQQGLLKIDIRCAKFNQVDSAKYHYEHDDTYLEPPTKAKPIGGANSGNDYMEVFDDTNDVQIYPIGGANGNDKNEPYHYAYDDINLEPPTKTEPIDGANSGNDYMEVFDNTNDVQIYPMGGANGNKKNEPYHDAYDDINLEPSAKSGAVDGATNDYMEEYPAEGANSNNKHDFSAPGMLPEST